MGACAWGGRSGIQTRTGAGRGKGQTNADSGLADLTRTERIANSKKKGRVVDLGAGLPRDEVDVREPCLPIRPPTQPAIGRNLASSMMREGDCAAGALLNSVGESPECR